MSLQLLVLLALPFAMTAVIVAVSAIRRGRETSAPTHRLQSDTAAVQAARVHSPATGHTVTSGRERRGAAAATENLGSEAA